MTPEDDATRAFRCEVSHAVLSAIASDDFALAGAGAILEHGISIRPIQDVDLFTARQDVEAFSTAVDQAVTGLHERVTPPPWSAVHRSSHACR
ncbi:hypothetical protein INN71_01230 [Nocardioides sp. ChNu-153]|uniref:hypothetical protein n=1 Tax=unclassified Nocardioides TaxID=2615069 RepID=UPI00240495B0|nr:MULTISPECIES: hypothetical protein [unclassified Nocardioides]MDF9714867.1 hypothetical protein [Nocardioides sp. ChNu-99]MDN7120007.1 hypothetical protein [Nocardioides sp. ChNu-153]